MINKPDILNEEDSIVEYTPEQNKKMADNMRFIIAKMVDVVKDLPDDVVLKHLSKPERAVEIFKPLTSQIYVDLVTKNVSIKDIRDSLDLLQEVVKQTSRRIVNYLDETISFINYKKYGSYEPEVDIAIGDWEKMRNDLAKEETLDK